MLACAKTPEEKLRIVRSTYRPPAREGKCLGLVTSLKFHWDGDRVNGLHVASLFDDRRLRKSRRRYAVIASIVTPTRARQLFSSINYGYGTFRGQYDALEGLVWSRTLFGVSLVFVSDLAGFPMWLFAFLGVLCAGPSRFLDAESFSNSTSLFSAGQSLQTSNFCRTPCA